MILFNTRSFAILSFAVLISSSQQAIAENKDIHVSGGIVSPSTNNSVHTNPAGLGEAKKSFVFSAGAPDIWNNGSYRAGFQTGDSNYGGAVGVDVGSGATTTLSAYYGVGVKFSSWSVGIAGRTGFVNAEGSNFNLGAMFDTGSRTKIGITAWGLQNSIDEWGLGIGLPLTTSIDFIVDMAAASNFKNPEVKPGLKYTNGSMGITASYGTGLKQEFADGFTAGMSFGLSSGSLIEVQYNAGGLLSKYYACLSLGL